MVRCIRHSIIHLCGLRKHPLFCTVSLNDYFYTYMPIEMFCSTKSFNPQECFVVVTLPPMKLFCYTRRESLKSQHSNCCSTLNAVHGWVMEHPRVLVELAHGISVILACGIESGQEIILPSVLPSFV